MASRQPVSQGVSCKRRVPGVDRTIDLLEMLVVSGEGLTLSAVARKLRIAKSSAHYLVYTLAARGYVTHGIDGQHFQLGPRAFDFANLTAAESK